MITLFILGSMSVEHSDSSFVYGLMSLDYGLGTMTATTSFSAVQNNPNLCKQCRSRLDGF